MRYTFYGSKPKERDRDPAPEVRKFPFGLPGCGGLAWRGSDGVSDVDGRGEGEGGADGRLRTEGGDRGGAGQVASAAPLHRCGSGQ